MMRMQGKKIWIIGASTGIGEALAKQLGKEGAALVLSARDGKVLEKLAGSLGAAHQALALDIRDQPALQSAAAQIKPLDAIVNLAALYEPGRVTELDIDKARTLLEVNILGSLLVAKLAPECLKKGGQLVLFGSVAGYLGLPKGQLYSATKAAVINLAESLRIELKDQVDVRLVCPGFVETRLTDKNQFRMPMIIKPEAAAMATIEGMLGNSFEIHYPKRFTYSLKLLRSLPYWAALPLLKRL